MLIELGSDQSKFVIGHLNRIYRVIAVIRDSTSIVFNGSDLLSTLLFENGHVTIISSTRKQPSRRCDERDIQLMRRDPWGASCLGVNRAKNRRWLTRTRIWDALCWKPSIIYIAVRRVDHQMSIHIIHTYSFYRLYQVCRYRYHLHLGNSLIIPKCCILRLLFLGGYVSAASYPSGQWNHHK